MKTVYKITPMFIASNLHHEVNLHREPESWLERYFGPTLFPRFIGIFDSKDKAQAAIKVHKEAPVSVE